MRSAVESALARYACAVAATNPEQQSPARPIGRGFMLSACYGVELH